MLGAMLSGPTYGKEFQEARPESMERSANCPFALGHDMLSRPRQVELAGCSPGLGRENMAPKFDRLLLISAR